MSLKIKYISGIIVFISLLFLFSFLSLTFEITHPWQTFTEILHASDEFSKEHVILISRLARVGIASLAGSSLALAGLLMQLHYRNALADPSLLGVSDGAMLSIVFMMAFGSLDSVSSRIGASILGSFAAYLFIRYMMQKVQQISFKFSLPLLGLIFSMMLNSLTTLVSSYFNLVQSVSSWYNSRLYRIEMSDIKYMVWPLLITIVFLFLFRRQLHIYHYDPELTLSLGMNRLFYEKILLFLGVLLTGVTVAIVGRIAFVGLIVPHIARMLYGNRYHLLVVIVPLFGAVFVSAADYLSRLILYPFEMPIGTVIAIIGVPIFLWLVQRRKGIKYEI